MPIARLRNFGQDLRRETGAALRQGSLMVRSSAQITGKHRIVASTEHALFVHGFMAHGAVFSPLREHVEKTTARSTSELSYGPLERFERVAERVARAIEESGKDRPIAVVGHSLGGLLLRWAIQELGADVHVDRMITLATPHFGTSAAKIGLGPLVTALRPGSEVLARLEASREKVSHIRHIALVAERDRMIRPVASAALPGAEVHWLGGVGHNEMLFHREVFDRVSDVLNAKPSTEREQ